MKLFLSALLITSTTAFLHSNQIRSANSITSSNKNSEASALFGSSSRIAKVAWDIIESEYTHASENSPSKAKLGQAQHNIKIQKFNPTLEKAVSKAEIATEWWGMKSKQAQKAWAAVEDLAMTDMSEVMKGAINNGEEDLFELFQASDAMEELERVLFVAKSAKSDE